MITLIDERELLDIEKRKAIIKAIQSDSNEARKAKKLKAYEIYKDLTKYWVIEAISKEFSAQTVSQMVARASNISIVRKIVDKKARAYAGGVSRAIDGEEANTQKVGDLVKQLNFDQLMKKADRMSELLKNVLVQILYKNDASEKKVDGKPRQRLDNRLFLPHQYDVIGHAHDPCSPLAYVLSDFVDTKMTILQGVASDSTGYREANTPQSEKKLGLMAGGSEKKATAFIFWSANLHFTCNDKGEYIPELSPDDMRNPVGELNAVSVHDDQDDGYWCEGGDDLIDGGVLVNVLLTDMFSIMNVQGWGQLVVSGKKVPASITGGPHKALVFEFDTGEPTPKVEYVSSNPPIEQWRESITMYVALLLSTNNLSTKNVSTKLEGGSSFPSGLAMMIDEAESTENIEDKQAMFKNVEAQVWRKNFLVHNYLLRSGVAVEAEAAIGEIATKKTVDVKFNQVKPIMSEAEKVDLIKKKKDTALYSIVELLQIADPDLTDDQAEEKALKLIEDRMKYAVLYQAGVAGVVKQMNGELQDQGEGQDDNADPAAPGMEAGAKLPASGAASGQPDVQKTALNGAQLASLVDTVAQVAAGTLPRDSAVAIIMQAFPYIDKAEAEAIVGKAGNGFVPKKEEPAPAAPGRAPAATNTPKEGVKDI